MSREATPAGMYRTREVAAITGATKRQLDYWNRTGVLPASQGGGKTGANLYYSFTDLVAAGVLTLLAVDGNGSGVKHQASMLDVFRPFQLALGLHMMHEVYGDWDGVIVVIDHTPEIMPSMDAAIARMREALDGPKAVTVTLMSIQQLVTQIMHALEKEARRGQAAVR